MFLENKREFFLLYCETKSLQYPLHVHQYIEYLRVEKGTVQMQIGTQNYTIRTGELALIFPNMAHDYHTLSTEGNTQLHIFNCYPDVIPMHKMDLLNMFPKHPVLSKNEIHPDILYAEKRLFEMELDHFDRTLVGSLVALMLSRIFPYLELADYSELPPQDMHSEIISYIGLHFREDISQESIARHFGVGKTSISHIFSRVLKVSFTQYLNSLRINYAEYLLRSTDLNMMNVAVECGYQNQQTFYRVFKSIHGCTPREYRTANLHKQFRFPPLNEFENLPDDSCG